MTDTVIKPEEISDALFSCVYSWVNGHAIDKKGADAAVARHRDSASPYGVLARRLCEFVAGSGPTYEELCDLGLVLTDASRQKENRIALVAEVIGDEVKQLLCDAERINRIFPQPKPEKKKRVTDAATSSLNQMGPSQRGEVLLDHYGGLLALHQESDTVHHYNGVIWTPISDKALARQMAAIFIEADAPYSMTAMKNAVDTMKLSLPPMGATERNLIGFSNGVFDTRKGVFRPHQREDWLLVASEVEFGKVTQGETLESHAPNFWRWLQHATARNDRKASRLLAALYMVMANRYDWQLFLEVTGPAGSGKSVMAEICTMLAGKGNTQSASMSALENPKERELLVGYSLIVMPDMTRYVGDGAGLKAITGGDKVSINPKYRQPYSMRIPAVILAVNNDAMRFSDIGGGISRRRVIFNFSDVVSEDQRDPMLVEKIESELPVIIRHLLTRFVKQDEVKQLLREQQRSDEAMEVKRGTDPIIDLCAALFFMDEAKGLMMGGGHYSALEPRKYLYHLYLAFAEYHGIKPLAVTNFGKAITAAAREYGQEYLTRTIKGRRQTNVGIGDLADEFMPRAYGSEPPKDEE